MGESARDKGVKNYMGELNSFGNDVKSKSFGVNNRFDSYKPQFGYSDMKKGLDNQFTQDSGILKNNYFEDRNTTQKDTAERLASQGITSGSVYNNNVNASGNAASKNYSNALKSLLSNRENANIGLMDNANKNQFNITNAASEIDLANISNLLRKYGLLNSTIGQQGQATQLLNDDTWFDDVLAIANTASNFIKPI